MGREGDPAPVPWGAADSLLRLVFAYAPFGVLWFRIYDVVGYQCYARFTGYDFWLRIGLATQMLLVTLDYRMEQARWNCVSHTSFCLFLSLRRALVYSNSVPVHPFALSPLPPFSPFSYFLPSTPGILHSSITKMPPPFPPSYFSASFLPASFGFPNFSRTHHTHTPSHLEFCVPQLPRNRSPPPSIISLPFHPDAPNFLCLCFLCVCPCPCY